MYGTIRMHQEREYPEHVSGTRLANPDFIALARAYGYAGVRVTRTARIRAGAAGRARAQSGHADRESCSTRMSSARAATLSSIRDKALQEMTGQVTRPVKRR